MKKSFAALSVALAVAGLGAATAVAAPPAPADGDPAGRALVCHVTGSTSNPMVQIYVPSNAKAPRTPCQVAPPAVEPPAEGGSF